MSRDREGESAPGVAASSSSNIRFRNQSPSTTHQRRSRERERTELDYLKEINHSLNQSADMSVDVDTYEDSRMTEELLGYPSLNSEDLEYPDSDPNKHQSTPSGRHNRTNSLQAIDRLTTKIACTKESIRKEQTARDGKILLTS